MTVYSAWELAEFFERFRYDPINGGLVYAKKTKRRKEGDPVGARPGPALAPRVVYFKKRLWTVSRIVWAMHNPGLPVPENLIHLDGDYGNLRIENLSEADTGFGKTDYLRLMTAAQRLAQEHPEWWGVTRSTFEHLVLGGESVDSIDWTRKRLERPGGWVGEVHRIKRRQALHLTFPLDTLKLRDVVDLSHLPDAALVAPTLEEAREVMRNAPAWFTLAP